MRIETSRFGPVEAPEDTVWAFPEGILGFPDVRQYALLPHPTGGGEFEWLQAIGRPELAFAVTDPLLFLPEYRAAVRPADLASIRLDELAKGVVRVIVVVRRDPLRITANLQGPLVFNPEARMAKQLVLLEGDWSTRHLLYQEERASSPGA